MLEKLFKKENEKKSLLTEKDIKNIMPYLNNAVNVEIKDYPGKRSVKEILIEYSDGRKMIGDLNSANFELRELKGLTSIAAYFARGKYGSNQYRGNASGLLIKDLLEHYQPNFIIDPCVGSGTSYDVAKSIGIDCLALDLNPKWGGFDMLKDELPRSTPFMFVHPPYFVPTGSQMPQYSGVMWGSCPHPSDGSHIHDPKEFTRWLNKVQANLYQALRKGGIMCWLVGDSRYRGQYYSMFRSMDIYGKLESVIIKRQFNCISDNTQYKKSSLLIPIEHEYLIIIRKDHELEIKCMFTKNITVNILKSKNVTWRALIQSVIEYCGGKASKEQIREILKDTPKAESNNHLSEKIRQIINQFKDEFIKNPDGTISLSI